MSLQWKVQLAYLTLTSLTDLVSWLFTTVWRKFSIVLSNIVRCASVFAKSRSTLRPLRTRKGRAASAKPTSSLGSFTVRISLLGRISLKPWSSWGSVRLTALPKDKLVRPFMTFLAFELSSSVEAGTGFIFLRAFRKPLMSCTALRKDWHASWAALRLFFRILHRLFTHFLHSMVENRGLGNAGSCKLTWNFKQVTATATDYSHSSSQCPSVVCRSLLFLLS